ncbi:MAG: branched-chain amino acid ABC transporter permease [Candidatus Dormiibacterota bacterium]
MSTTSTAPAEVLPDEDDERLRERFRNSTLLRHGFFFIVLAGVLLLVTNFVFDDFTNYNVTEIAIFAISAAGLTVLTGINGQVSLGHGALMMIGAYTTSVLLKWNPEVPFILTVIASMVTTAIAGGIIGIAGARLRGPYLAGATLSLAVALPQVPTHFASIFGGNQGISVLTPSPPDFLGGSFSAFEWFDWVCLAAALITFFLLANVVRGATGRRLRMVRDNEVAARLAGVNVARTQVLAYVISAVCAGLAGSLFAYWATITSPTGFTLNLSLSLLTAIVVGGLGSLTGAVIGSFILVYLPVWTGGFASNLNLASNIANNVPLAIYGIVLIVAILVFPRGIAGELAALGRHVARLRSRRETSTLPAAPAAPTS